MSDRPNILYIMTDQQQAAAMSCAGHPDVRTPNMDRLAERGVRFTSAYCTFPVCTPSRGSMWTGLMPHQHGAVTVGGAHSALREDLRTQSAGHVLGRAGYRCVYGGKWHAGNGGIHCSLDDEQFHGFEKICGFNDIRLPEACDTFLRSYAEPRPFFLVASFDDPHNICEWAHGVMPIWGDLGDPPAEEDCPPLPANFVREPYQPTTIKNLYHKRTHGATFDMDLDTRTWRQLRWAYFRMIERVDARIGVILDALDGSGHAANTLVIFSSDHGEQAGSHGLHQKGVIYEESVRVPLIVAGPGIAPGVVTDTPVSNGLDLLPTLADYAGVDLPGDLPGLSLRPELEQRGSLQRTSVFAEICGAPDWQGRITDGCRMVRSTRYKYVVFEQGLPREQLFDLERDPGEMVNLITCRTYDAVRDEHREMMRQWMQLTDDRFGSGHYGFRHEEIRFMLPGDEYPVKDTLR